jgi:hypothetical protein
VETPVSRAHGHGTSTPDPGAALLLSRLVGELAGRDVVRGVVAYRDPVYGPVVRLVVDLDAREALDLWLKLARPAPRDRRDFVMGVRWLGEDNVSRDELADYLAKIMVEGGLRTTALEPLDAVRELRGERSRRR